MENTSTNKAENSPSGANAVGPTDFGDPPLNLSWGERDPPPHINSPNIPAPPPSILRNASTTSSTSLHTTTMPNISKPSLSRVATPNYVPPMRDPSKNKFDDTVYSDDSFISGDGQSPRPPHHSPSNSTSKVLLRVNDILKVNPLESEAETLILKAIERQDAIQQQQQSRSRSNTGSNSLLGNVPNDAIDIFMAEEKKASMDYEETPASPATSLERGTNRPPRPPPRVQPPPSIPKPTFYRNQSTEETLAALTMAMEGYQVHQAGDAYQDDLVHERKLTENAHVQSAAEAFAQNANLVFRGPKVSPKPSVAVPQQRRPSQTVAAPSPPPTTDHCGTTGGVSGAATNWSKLRTAVQTSTVAELNGINITGFEEDPKMTDGMYDVEVGHDIPFDEQYGTGDLCAATVPLTNGNNGTPSGRSGSSRNKNHYLTMALSKGAVQDLKLFVRQRQRSFMLYTRLLSLLIIPALATSCILFYFADNVPTGKVDLEASFNDTLVNTNGTLINKSQASVSWWILFICVRQALTFSLAQLLQVFVIDFLCLNTRFFKTLFGNLVTLLIAQSKGWPFIAFTWGLLDFALLHGQNKFASSWLFWQDFFAVFNEVNPGGKVTSNEWNSRVLAIAVSVGVIVSIKRLWLGLFLGKKTFVHYAEELTNVVKKAVLLCEVATLARDFYYGTNGGNTMRKAQSVTEFGMSKEALSMMLQKSAPVNEDNADVGNTERSGIDDGTYSGGLIIDTRRSDMLRDHLDHSQRVRISELLGAWEEPEAEGGAEDNVTISSILQFRNSLSLLDNSFMFGIAWGDVSTRAKMVIGSQEVYQRLLLPSPDTEVLKFDVLALVALEQDGRTLNHDKLEDLIRLLRPDRDGHLSLLDFVKSTDCVYKEAKLLRASIRNSEHIDRAFEKATNVVFYTILTCVILSRIGIDPIALFLSLSGLILAFAFMIGSASAKMFEGFLFILVRRPYSIGDRIHISNVESDTDPTGSSGWIVKDVTLFHTTLVYGATGERATMANGSLASSRVINMARSPKACVGIDLKFATDAPHERIKIFDQTLRDFVKARPREWANFNGFRAGKICADLGYIEYSVSLSHREAWQNIIAIINSKAEVAAFCLELSKQLDLRVQSPALPIDLNFAKRVDQHNSDYDSLAAKFTKTFGGSGYVQVMDANDE
jgi:Mechanosensitive ion channel